MYNTIKSLSIQSIDYRIFFSYGVLLRANGKLNEAETYQRRAIEINPSFSEAYYNLANLLKDKNKLEEAIGQIEIAKKQSDDINPQTVHFPRTKTTDINMRGIPVGTLCATTLEQSEWYEFVDEIPKSNVGKILRRELREINNNA